MKNGHLTEEEIQELLDRRISVEPDAGMRHVKRCDACRKIFEEYQSLYRGLAADPGFRLPKHFAGTVASRAVHAQISPFLSSRFEVMLIAAGVILAVVGVFLLTRSVVFMNAVKQMVIPALGLESTITQPIKDLLSGLNGSLILVPFAVLALVFVVILDRFLQKLKHHNLS